MADALLRPWPATVGRFDPVHFQARVLQDALTQATADYWLKRAETFEAARPKQGDYHGKATRAELQAADQRCAMLAENCRRQARLILADMPTEDIDPDVAYTVRQVADALGTVAA